MTSTHSLYLNIISPYVFVSISITDIYRCYIWDWGYYVEVTWENLAAWYYFENVLPVAENKLVTSSLLYLVREIGSLATEWFLQLALIAQFLMVVAVLGEASRN